MAGSAKKAGRDTATGGALTDEERAAMRDRLRDTTGEGAVLEKIAGMQGKDRAMGQRIHEIISKNAPDLVPRTWYGMPAYAGKDGKVICFFQSAGRFKARYATLGFNDTANLDEGNMWPTSFALKELTASEESKIAALVKKAVG